MAAARYWPTLCCWRCCSPSRRGWNVERAAVIWRSSKPSCWLASYWSPDAWLLQFLRRTISLAGRPTRHHEEARRIVRGRILDRTGVAAGQTYRLATTATGVPTARQPTATWLATTVAVLAQRRRGTVRRLPEWRQVSRPNRPAEASLLHEPTQGSDVTLTIARASNRRPATCSAAGRARSSHLIRRPARSCDGQYSYLRPGHDRHQLAQLVDDPATPLVDRALSGCTHPGRRSSRDRVGGDRPGPGRRDAKYRCTEPISIDNLTVDCRIIPAANRELPRGVRRSLQSDVRAVRPGAASIGCNWPTG